jgi:Ca2+-binding EF-hand superfamily protein|mmetsp:Transcript_15980/g.21693  ORF Transcript_15980/g.21693 Transcript_15980/m.21693 type:complete len:145 (+) Transcript_15980:830-1264(+)
MEKTKQERANFRVQHIPIEEMFTAQELMDLKTAFEAVSMGEAFVNTESLKALFADMQIYPTDEQLQELLETCGKRDEEDFISFELFARSVALLLEENADKVSTSSQQNQGEDQDAYYGDEIPGAEMQAMHAQMMQQQAYQEYME